MYRNVLFRAIIENMQWGGAGRGSGETAAPARGAGAVCGTCGASTTNPYNPPPQSHRKSGRGAADVNTALKDLSEKKNKREKKSKKM